MVRKRRTDHPAAGKSSEPQEQTGHGGRVGPQHPPERAPIPQQQGGGDGRVWGPSQPQQLPQYGGRGGRYYQGRGGGPQPRGRMASHYLGTPPSEYQGHGGSQHSEYQGCGGPQHSEYQGRGGPQLSEYQGRGGPRSRGGMPPQQFYGGRMSGSSMGGGRGAAACGPSRPAAPELHQASESPTYQASLPAPSQPSTSISVVQEVQQLSIQTETTTSQATPPVKTSQAIQPAITSQAIQPVASTKALRFPLRPGKGSIGTRCVVKANHFLCTLADKDLHQYDVSITPEVTSRSVNRAVMAKLVTLYRETHLGGRLPVYDGRKSLYTAGALPFSAKEFQVTLTDEYDGTGTERRQGTFKIVIKFASHPNLHHLRMFLSGRQADSPQEAFQVLDIVLRESLTVRYYSVGRSFYAPELGSQQLGEGLQSWRGFYQSIRPTQMGLSLNISNHINRALRGIKVEVTHRGNMRRKYRISGLTSQSTRELTFPVDERGTMKSVVQYFQETYAFTIQHTNWPCLQVGNQQRPNYLPMEVCKIVKGQRYSKRLNERQITALLNVTCLPPHKREHLIIKTVEDNAYNNDDYAKEFGIEIINELAQVEARILPAPWLKYHDSGREKYCLPRIGQWNMKDKKMVNAGRVNSWMCISFDRNVRRSVAREFCHKLAQMCHDSGMQFSLEPVLPLVTAEPDQVEQALNDLYRQVMSIPHLQKKELDLLIVILPTNNGSLYGDLKRICETDLGLVSQCCLTKHVFKMSMQYFANMALKINVKVGGRNTVLAHAMPLVTTTPTIIFGADVTHPHPGEDLSPSIAAVVASQDWPEMAKYAGLVCAQEHRQEIIQDLFKEWEDPHRGSISGGMIRELLISFHGATRQKPKRIIFYRDGLSEGQFYQALEHELGAIQKACASLEPDYRPRITFVVVQKRHHTRLFADNHANLCSVDKSGNILPGTVVDSMICHPTEFDFYLCSHAGIKGTSRPAHYHVLWDENNFSADDLQLLTNNLCYTYARCTRSVSIVPPAYYAHLAAFRARFYIQPDASDSDSIATPAGRAPPQQSQHPTRVRKPGDVRPLPALKENVKRVMFYC